MAREEQKKKRRSTKREKKKKKNQKLLTSLANGSFLIRRSVERWYLRISLRATTPGRYLVGFRIPPVWVGGAVCVFVFVFFVLFLFCKGEEKKEEEVRIFCCWRLLVGREKKNECARPLVEMLFCLALARDSTNAPSDRAGCFATSARSTRASKRTARGAFGGDADEKNVFFFFFPFALSFFFSLTFFRYDTVSSRGGRRAETRLRRGPLRTSSLLHRSRSLGECFFVVSFREGREDGEWERDLHCPRARKRERERAWRSPLDCFFFFFFFILTAA